MTTVYILFGVTLGFVLGNALVVHWVYRKLHSLRGTGPSRSQIRKWRRDRVLMVAPNRRRQ